MKNLMLWILVAGPMLGCATPKLKAQGDMLDCITKAETNLKVSQEGRDFLAKGCYVVYLMKGYK